MKKDGAVDEAIAPFYSIKKGSRDIGVTASHSVITTELHLMATERLQR